MDAIIDMIIEKNNIVQIITIQIILKINCLIFLMIELEI